MATVAPFPQPQACHACEVRFAGSHCPNCKAERPVYTALKKWSAERRAGVAPLREPKVCRYFPKSICGCDGRGTCLSAV